MTRALCTDVCIAAALLLSLSTTTAQEPWLFDAGSENQSGLVFSPDGNTAYWAEWDGEWGSSDRGRSTIYVSLKLENGWSAPEPAPFSGRHSDDDPFVSPDGRWLYFVSDRPSEVDDEPADADIWRFSLTNARIERLSVNSNATEFSPVVTFAGALYFASNRKGGHGRGDIYRADASGEDFHPAEPLGPAINSSTGEWNVWVSADENILLFEASSRATNLSIPGDLYCSRRTERGWAPAVPLTSLNSENSDLLPRLHPDGKTLYYTTAPIGGNARIEMVDFGTLSSESAPADKND